MNIPVAYSFLSPQDEQEVSLSQSKMGKVEEGK